MITLSFVPAHIEHPESFPAFVVASLNIIAFVAIEQLDDAISQHHLKVRRGAESKIGRSARRFEMGGTVKTNAATRLAILFSRAQEARAEYDDVESYDCHERQQPQDDLRNSDLLLMDVGREDTHQKELIVVGKRVSLIRAAKSIIPGKPGNFPSGPHVKLRTSQSADFDRHGCS
jgi:hypothetical protein